MRWSSALAQGRCCLRFKHRVVIYLFIFASFLCVGGGVERGSVYKINEKMALVGGEEEGAHSKTSIHPATTGSAASRSSLAFGIASRDRDTRVQELKATLVEALGPYEPLVTYLQSVLVWEKPLHSLLLYVGVNGLFWFFVLTSLRMIFLLSFSLTVIVCIDTWKNKIWPEFGVKHPEDPETESWGLVHPGLLSIPELCHHVAALWVSGVSFSRNLMLFKHHNPGKFCLLACGFFTFLAVLGRYISGLLLSYGMLLALLLCPLAMYHKVGQKIHAWLEPALLRFDFSVRGYMMTKQKERQMLNKGYTQGSMVEGSDSEEELAAFCPKLDDTGLAKELAITDSEHSDAEVSYTDNGTFNLSRGQTPLTEGSEDLDRHSDPEESFARDLPDFPSINPEATILDDDEDTSIGIPSVSYRSFPRERGRLYSDQEEIDAELSLSGLPPPQNFTTDLAGVLASNMIQAALIGAAQSSSQRDATQRATRGYRKQSSSELDTDVEGDDFEMLDQSELNQIDPTSSQSHQKESQQAQHSSSGFLANLLRKQ
ncbi:reticulophagy regulator 3 [Erpetoichthys calabaricus]|uniref:Reticulophagy regulator family member 3 n=1 Tax=Erpetoichthys calabaricus TaxID=27687 RepID=A0A8C4XAD9_ERPCA|nr:reticulophagy regulator 3 [Erpetoichthys calabaricus]